MLLKSLFHCLFILSLSSFGQKPEPIIIAGIPPINGTPEVLGPKLLDWKTDFPSEYPDLTEPTSNRIYDLHMQVNDCDTMDLILSTSGNYHMALTEFWYDYFLPKHALQNWYFSTSPPIGYEQTKNGVLSYSNVALHCRPHLAVGPKVVIDALAADNLILDKPIPLFENRGNVLLVKKGNPKNIKSIWDLGKTGVRVATSNPYTEAGSFGNYAASIYRIALADKGKEGCGLPLSRHFWEGFREVDFGQTYSSSRSTPFDLYRQSRCEHGFLSFGPVFQAKFPGGIRYCSVRRKYRMARTLARQQNRQAFYRKNRHPLIQRTGCRSRSLP